MRSAFLCLLAGLLLAVGVGSRPAVAFEPGRLGFSLRVDGELSDYERLLVPVLPGRRLALRFTRAVVLSQEGRALGPARREHVWQAPTAPGRLRLTAAAGGQVMTLEVAVMRPAREMRDGSLNGYKIGSYAKKALRDLAIYHPPAGFIEVTPELLELPVSPHFTLGQFLCKQEGGWPRYLLLRPALLVKLERLLEAVNRHGWRTEGFHVMSAYRTPWYNAAIGNETLYSRHLYGGAADIFIDAAPRDGVMDDLDGDGRSGKGDADALYDLVARLTGAKPPLFSPGGLGSYGATASHGPFVHVDARGFPARWGR